MRNGQTRKNRNVNLVLGDAVVVEKYFDMTRAGAIPCMILGAMGRAQEAAPWSAAR